MEIKRIRSNVEMLPTGKEMNIGTDKHWFTGRHLIFNGIEQHLYFTTDEQIPRKIDAECVVYNPKLNKIIQNPTYLMEGEKLVVSSTDTSLNLPQPSQVFIKQYVNLGGIDEVLVEYELRISPNGRINTETKLWEQIKVDSHNTITIHAIKDSWNKKEMEDIHVAVTKQGCLYEGGVWSDEHERLVRLEFNKYSNKNL